jgi:RNA polymerase sigma factor (sigma-70 family)
VKLPKIHVSNERHMMAKTYMDAQQELELIRRAQNGDSWAENQLVCALLPIMRSYVSRWSNKEHSLHEDMLQEGLIGIMSAIRRFNEAKNSRLKTYAEHLWCRRIQRFVELERVKGLGGTKGLSTRGQRRVKRVYNEMDKSGDVAANLAKKTGVKRCTAEGFIRLQQPGFMVSLDKTDGTGEPWGASFPGKFKSAPEILDSKHFREFIEESLENTPKEKWRAVLKWRYLNRVRYSHEEIGQQLGVSRERVRQIEGEILHFLAKRYRSKCGPFDIKPPKYLPASGHI